MDSFQLATFKVDSFPFSIVRMPDMSSNVPSTILYSGIGASNNPDLFSIAIKPFITRMSRQGVYIENIKECDSKIL